MAEQAQENTSLSTAVADVASGVVLALEGEHGSYALSELLVHDEAVALAVIRVLGADVLAPYAGGGANSGASAGGRAGGAASVAGGGADERLVRAALAAYPPGADASEVSVWTYGGLAEAARAYLPGGSDGWPGLPDGGSRWLAEAPWPKLAHRASQLAALSLPGLAPALTAGLAARTEDLARGFVRAVRRRDWLQSAGVGRWLAGLPGVPDTLGLDAGMVYVRRMSGGDPRVALHTAAARRFHGRGPR
ncbi:hypothetical protein [Actinacidiphila yeochonensis]|uniref:hypothetical protein n=1 Tax=Actinacidiphila yeochonensis TaxID=89050 RepID=UPI000B2ADB09|nr:hypothetical protein [Actinacidiphila yeochonensis]